MSRVAIIRCSSYERSEVEGAVERGIDLLGGMSSFIKPEERVLLKPNLLAPDPPEKCTTTHPEVFRAVANLALKAGADVTYGDSPAVGTTTFTAKRAGIYAMGEELGIPISDFSDGVEVSYDQGLQHKKFTIARAVKDAHHIISIPKLKTHALARLTGAIKNQFGCVPGFLKGEFHVKIPDAHNFARMLIDLNNLVKPTLYIMDGIQAMEGNGPRGGGVKQMNVLLFSADPLALDATVCRLVDIDPQFVPTIKYGEEAHAGFWRQEDITILGDDITQSIDSTFNVKRRPVKPYKGSGLYRFVSNALVEKPAINPDVCTHCGVCVQSCPVSPKALSWEDGKQEPPVYNYDTCIRCYCCQELCPESAITLKAPPMRKFLRLFSR